MNTYCDEIGVHCHVGPVEVFLLHLFLLYGSVLVFLGAGITCRILKQSLKRENTPEK